MFTKFRGFHGNKSLSKFEGLKSHPVPSFKQQGTFHIKKQSLSFQNIISKLRATHEMNFWEREIQKALEWNLTFLTWQFWGSARHTNQYSNNASAKIRLIKAISSPTVIHTCFIDIRWKTLHQFSAEKNSYAGFQVFELALLMYTCTGSSSYHDQGRTQRSVQNLYSRYLSCLVYN